jgi:hypothetical protein
MTGMNSLAVAESHVVFSMRREPGSSGHRFRASTLSTDWRTWDFGQKILARRGLGRFLARCKVASKSKGRQLYRSVEKLRHQQGDGEIQQEDHKKRDAAQATMDQAEKDRAVYEIKAVGDRAEMMNRGRVE